jgi:murein DD-endopeptidase MepM/ murein hydrolase activator NlpD
MKYFILTLLLPLLSGCASAKNPIQKEMTIRPGEVRWLEFEIPNESVRLFCKDQEVKSQRFGKIIRAAVVETYFSDLNPFTCYFKEKDQNLVEVFFKVESKEYKSEQLRVDAKRIKLSPKDQRRADKEQVILNKIYASSLNTLQFKTPFREPLSSHVTSVYGTKRVYNQKKKGQHLGTDYRAAIGDKVPSANAGLDIFTVYGHLSKTLVDAGQKVEKGQLIGLSGNTGRTSGPHLHWGVKVQGQYIDGPNLVEESKKIFNE